MSKLTTLIILAVLILIASGILLVSFTFSTLESGYLTISVAALFLFYFYRRRASDTPPNSIIVLLDIAELLFGTLAITCIFDGWDISFLGKGADGETGLLVGLAAFILIISRRYAQPNPDNVVLSVVFWCITLLMVGWAPMMLTKYSFRIDNPAVIPIWQLVMLIAVLLCVRRRLAELPPGIRVLLASGVSLIILKATYGGTTGSHVALLCAGIACLLIFVRYAPQQGEVAPGSDVVVRIGSGIAFSLLFVGGLAPLLCFSNDVRTSVGFALLMAPALVYLLRRIGRLTVVSYWTWLLLMQFCMIYFAIENPMSPVIKLSVERYFPLGCVAIALLHLLLRIIYKERPIWVNGQQSFPKLNIKLVCSVCMFTVTTIIIGATTTVPISILVNNHSPSRLMLGLYDTRFWPGMPLFITLAMHDEYYYADKVAWRLPDTKDPGALVKQLRKGTPDSFSYYDDINDVYRPTPIAGIKPVSNPGKLGLEIIKDKDSYLVVQVHRSSPAGAAGIRRGEHLVAVDGVPVDTASKIYPLSNSSVGEKVKLTIRNNMGNVRVVPLTYVAKTLDTPYSRVLPSSRGPVGYLYLSHFDKESLQGVEMEFAKLRKAGVHDMVLDLRYNGGGKVDHENRIAAFLAGQHNAGKLFGRNIYSKKYRDENNEEFLPEVYGALDIKRLVVITTALTCSASEGVINGLKPFMDVKTVGYKTCGKPMMMEPFFIGGKENGTTLNIINAVTQNSRGEGDYFDGIKPDCPYTLDEHHEYGDPQEAMTAEALYLLETGTCRTVKPKNTLNTLRLRHVPDNL